MTRIATVFGGSGFLGRYIVQRLARSDWRVRVAVRNPNEAIFVRPYGVPGQVEPMLANVRDDASVAEMLVDADAVVNCVSARAGETIRSDPATASIGRRMTNSYSWCLQRQGHANSIWLGTE